MLFWKLWTQRRETAVLKDGKEILTIRTLEKNSGQLEEGNQGKETPTPGQEKELGTGSELRRESGKESEDYP